MPTARVLVQRALQAASLLAWAAAGCSGPAKEVEAGQGPGIAPARYSDFRLGKEIAGISLGVPYDETEERRLKVRVRNAIAQGQVAKATWIGKDTPSDMLEWAKGAHLEWEYQGLDLVGIQGGDLRRVLIHGTLSDPVLVLVELAPESWPGDVAAQTARLGLTLGAPAYLPAYTTEVQSLFYRTDQRNLYLLVQATSPGGPRRVIGVAHIPGTYSLKGSNILKPWEEVLESLKEGSYSKDNRTLEIVKRMVGWARRAGAPEADQAVAAVEARMVEMRAPKLAKAEAAMSAAGATLDQNIRSWEALLGPLVEVTIVLDRVPQALDASVRRCAELLSNSCAEEGKRAAAAGKSVESSTWAEFAAQMSFDPAAPLTESAIRGVGDKFFALQKHRYR